MSRRETIAVGIRTNRLHATTSGKPETTAHYYSCAALQNTPLEHH